MSVLPYPVIWLEPVCDKCGEEAEVTWCQDDVYEPCPLCGKKGIRYLLDRRQRARCEESTKVQNRARHTP